MLINFLGFCPTYTVIWTLRLLSTLAYLARIGLSIFICLLFLCQKVKTLFEKKSFLQYQLTDRWFSNDCISFSIACSIEESWLGSFLSLDLSSSLMKFKIMMSIRNSLMTLPLVCIIKSLNLSVRLLTKSLPSKK